MAGRGVARITSRTPGSSNLGDSSRRRPPLAHEREQDTSPSSRERSEGWKSLSDGRVSPISNRPFPGKGHRYSLDDDRSLFEDKKSGLDEKRTLCSDVPNHSNTRTSYEYNDQRTSYNEKKSLYSKESDEETRSSYDKKPSYDNKRNLYDKKSLYDKSSYDGDRYSRNEKELTDIRPSYEKKSLYDKDSGDVVVSEKKLYDDQKSSFGDKKRNTERYNDRNLFDSKRSLYSEKKSLYDDYDKPTKANERRSPIDWKSRGKDVKPFASVDIHTHDRKSSDEDWDLSDDIKRPLRKSPIQGRKPTIGIWRPKINRGNESVDRKVSDEEWDSPVHKASEGFKSYSEQRKSGGSKGPDEDWDSPANAAPSQRTSTRKSFGEQKNANDEDWNPSHQRSSYYRKSGGELRKAQEERKLSDDEWDSSAPSRGIKLSNDERKDSGGTWRSASREADEKPSSTLPHRRGDGDRKSPGSHRKSSDEDGDYSYSYKSYFNDGKSSSRDRKSTTDTRKSSSSQKSYQEDADWNSPVHQRPTGGRKSHSERKSFGTESDEEQKLSTRHRLSGNDRKYLPDISHVLELVDKVKLRNAEVMTETLNEVEKEIRHCVSHPEYTRVLVMKMYDRCKGDQEFALRAGALFGLIHNLKFGDLSVKAVLLRCVQHDLEEKQHEQGEENQFLNSIFLLSELYHHIRINNLPVSILGEALLKHLEPLLLGEESELELLATCLIVNGPVLLQDQPLKFSKLTMKIRTVLIKETLSTKSRGWLLLIIELSSRDFAPLLPETCKWYRSLLGSTTFEKFERLKPFPAVPL